MEKMGVNSSHPMTCLQWDTLLSRISNSIDNLPLALGAVKLLKVYFSRLLTKEDFRKAVKERWTAERSVEFKEKMRMLIPAQFPKVWGETRIANKIGIIGELAGKTHRINTGGVRDTCLCISGEYLTLDWTGLAS